jgi:hypothetical protein
LEDANITLLLHLTKQWMRHTPLTWNEQGYEHYQAHFGNSPLITSLTSCFDEGWTPKGAACRREQSTRAHKTYQISTFQLA